jgi:hypothetical protein
MNVEHILPNPPPSGAENGASGQVFAFPAQKDEKRLLGCPAGVGSQPISAAAFLLR